MSVDTTFDFVADAGGRDPDRYSPLLRRYHRALWSKPLPGGQLFELNEDKRHHVLVHDSELGEFRLTSDTMNPTFFVWESMRPITSSLSEEEQTAFQTATKSIGGMVVFPGNQIERKWTINMARGCLRSIADRFDLTLECIRRHYAGEDSPLETTLSRYADFFGLFRDFKGYTKFFLLDDLVNDDGSVRFFLPFADFGTTSPFPGDLDEYRAYREAAMAFIAARAERMASTEVQVA